jgi:hypothetical protein
MRVGGGVTMATNLIVVRAGDASLHPYWYRGRRRNWHLAVSYYGDLPDPYVAYRDIFHRAPGSKWEGLTAFFEENGDLVSRYERIWLPDDDIFTDSETICRFFGLQKRFGFALAQPALQFGSYFTHKVTLGNPLCIARQTDFVEIMAPSFDVRAWPLVEATLGENSSGWGLEWLWASILTQRGLKMGVLDGAAMRHTRPVGSAGHGGATSPPREEMSALLTKYGLESREGGEIARHARVPWVHKLLNFDRANRINQCVSKHFPFRNPHFGR